MKRITLPLLASLFLLACTNNESNENGSVTSSEKLTGQATELASAKGAEPGHNTCLLQYQAKYDALLPEELILSVTGFTKENMTTSYGKIMNPEHHSFSYKFMNKRVGRVKGLKGEFELPDIVSVHSIKSMSDADFLKNYQVITAEELQATKDNVAEIAKKDDRIKEEKETIRKVANPVLDAFKEISEGYEAVENLGDKAVWNSVSHDLTVLEDGVKFEIRSEISNDNQKNKATAMQLAKSVLGRCK